MKNTCTKTKKRAKGAITCLLAGVMAIVGGIFVAPKAAVADTSITLDATSVVDLTGATASIATKTYGAGMTQETTVEGLLISSDTAYSGSFRKVFSGDTTFTYRFPGTYVVADEVFKFTVKSVKTNDSFDIIYRGGSSRGNRCQVYVSYMNGTTQEFRSTATFSAHVKKITNAVGVGSVGQINGKISDDLDKNKKDEQFKIEVLDDVVNVYSVFGEAFANQGEKLMCSFDGTIDDSILGDDAPTADETAAKNYRWDVSKDANTDDTIEAEYQQAYKDAQNKCFMPKIDFSEGYTIEFSSADASGTDVLFLGYTLDSEDDSSNFKDISVTATEGETKVYNGSTEVAGGGTTAYLKARRLGTLTKEQSLR